MSLTTCETEEMSLVEETVPFELLELKQRVRELPRDVRTVLEPIVDEAWEEAVFRGRVLNVAKDALERLRLDLELTRFDLDATKREREELLKRFERRGRGA